MGSSGICIWGKTGRWGWGVIEGLRLKFRLKVRAMAQDGGREEGVGGAHGRAQRGVGGSR